MSLEAKIAAASKKAIKNLYDAEIDDSQIQLQQTRKEFEGDITLVVFPFVKLARKAPEAVANEIGAFLVGEIEEVTASNLAELVSLDLLADT